MQACSERHAGMQVSAQGKKIAKIPTKREIEP
jgi:hypothetical protein